jgi:hypothetical protein
MADTAVIFQQCYAWQENNYSDATSRFRNYLHNPSPRIVAPGWRGEVGNGGGLATPVIAPTRHDGSRYGRENELACPMVLC